MPIVESVLARLRDPRLAAKLADHATSPLPAWLWSTEGSRIVWANAVGAAIFGAADAGECEKRRFNSKDPAAAQIIRLAATLPPSGQVRLERLRGFGADFGRALTCLCSRLILADGTAAVFIMATEPAGPPLTLRERVRRLFADRGRTLAAFAREGTLLYATAPALTRFVGTATLSTLGVDTVAAPALVNGSASGASPYGPVTVERLGSDASTVLVLTFGAQVGETPWTAAEAPAPAAAPTPSRVEAPLPAPPTMGAPAAAPPPPAQARANGAPPAEASAGTASPASPAQGPAGDSPLAERRHPLRFVWQMDADGRFVVGSDEFIELMGPRTTAAFGRLWSEIAAELNLDPDNQVARAVATHETWSSITLSWPVDDSRERLAVELSGLPVFGRNRNFRGYRGFGVLRDIARTNQLARERRERPLGFMAQPDGPTEGGGRSASPAVNGAAPSDTQAASPAPPVVAAPEPAAAAAAAPEPAAAASATPAAPEIAARSDRPAADGAAANVVPFRSGAPTDAKAPSLSPVERKAFRELAQELTARLRGASDAPDAESGSGVLAAEEQKTPPAAAEAAPAAPPPSPDSAPPAVAREEPPAVASAIASAPETAPASAEAGSPHGQDAETAQRLAPVAFEPVLLDRIPLGVLLYRNDTLLYANRRLLEWTGRESLDALAAAGGLDTLFAAPGVAALAPSGGARPLAMMTRGSERVAVEGRRFTVPWSGGSALALVLTSSESEERERATAVALGAAASEIHELKARLQSFEKTEEELQAAKREAHKAAAAKADFLAKVSHEIRTPLNAITGFAEVIMAERFGPIGNERYRDYLKDIHIAGTHLVSLLNDLLDLSKIETGQLDLNFAPVGLNELTQQCVGIMQPQASRARIIIRTSLTPRLPQVVADERSLRQIVLNLLSNSIKFTGPGGQVIVSTACADSGETVLRVRDTGVGMSPKDVEVALEPFRQTATSGSWGSGGTGLGLPLTRALAEANRAQFSIKSAPNAGTLVEIAFPPTRVIAQ
jgi:signal transduction histidine kinase